MTDQTSNRTDKVRDPVCGMRFRPEKAVSVVDYRGEVVHFCTNACRRRFDRDPERYLGDGTGNRAPST